MVAVGLWELQLDWLSQLHSHLISRTGCEGRNKTYRESYHWSATQMLSKVWWHQTWPSHRGEPVTRVPISPKRRTSTAATVRPTNSGTYQPRDATAEATLPLRALSCGRERQEEEFKPSSWTCTEVITINYAITGNIAAALIVTEHVLHADGRRWAHGLQWAALIPSAAVWKLTRVAHIWILKSFGVLCVPGSTTSLKSHKKTQ